MIMENTNYSVQEDIFTQQDPKHTDTSLPGREEEVIVNEQEQNRITNTDNPVVEENEGERRYKEGLQDNSSTEENK